MTALSGLAAIAWLQSNPRSHLVRYLRDGLITVLFLDSYDLLHAVIGYEWCPFDIPSSLDSGIRSAKEKPSVYLGSFARYADDE